MENEEDCNDTSVNNADYNFKAKRIQAGEEKFYGTGMFGENKH